MQTVQTNWEKLEPTDLDSVIVRYGGELGIKGAWTRNAYERRLRKNIKTVLKHYAISYRKIIRKYGRLFLKTSLTTESSTKLARVFGISSLSPALETTSKLEDIIDRTSKILSGKGDYTDRELVEDIGTICKRLIEVEVLLGSPQQCA